MRNSKGFSMLELMIALGVFAILAAFAIPNYIGWRHKQHLHSSAVEVKSAINQAKMTAIRYNTDVVLTFNPANDTYSAFIDNDDDGIPEATDENGAQDAGERTIYTKGMLPNVDLQFTTLTDNRLIFNSRGLEASGNDGDITLIDSKGEVRTVSVTVTGLTRIQ